MGPATADGTKRGQRGCRDTAAAAQPPLLWVTSRGLGRIWVFVAVRLKGRKVKCPWVREERLLRPPCPFAFACHHGWCTVTVGTMQSTLCISLQINQKQRWVSSPYEDSI